MSAKVLSAIAILLIGAIMASEAAPHHDSSSSEESYYYGPRRVKYRYKNYYFSEPNNPGTVSASASASASAGSSPGSPHLVEQPIPPAAGGYYSTRRHIDSIAQSQANAEADIGTRIAHRPQPLLPTLSPEEIAASSFHQTEGRPQPLLPTTLAPPSSRRPYVPNQETVYPRPLLPTQRPASYTENRPTSGVSGATASASAQASAGTGTRITQGSNGGGSGTGQTVVVQEGYYPGSYDLNHVNEGVSTILDGVGRGSLAEILRGSFAFTRNGAVKNIANNVIDSIFGRRGTDVQIWPSLNSNGRK